MIETGDLKANSQLDRLEKKMDRILELLESKELSIVLDGKRIAEISFSEIERRKNASRLF